MAKKKIKLKKRRSDQNRLILVTVLCAIALVAILASTVAIITKSHRNAVTANATASTTMTEPETTTCNEADISISMVGDVLIHYTMYETGQLSDGSYNFNSFFKNVISDVSSSDINIVNQETILGGTQLGLQSYPAFNSPQEVGDAEVAAGFNVVLHATNHAIDMGFTGLNSCLTFWNTKYPEMAVLGIHNTESTKDDIYVYEKDGFKVAILNYTYGTNGIAIPSEAPYCVNILDEDRVIGDIARAKQIADAVVVTPHWGTEYQYKPTEEQQYWANIFLECGVDLVIGTHPHVLEPVEMLTGTDGHQMLVYWSLGNFISSQDRKDTMVGGIAKVNLHKASNGEVSVSNYDIIPVVTQKSRETCGFTTYRLTDYSESLAAGNAIHYNEGCDDFTYAYCKQLCNLILGTEY